MTLVVGVEAQLGRDLKLQGIEASAAGEDVQELNHLAEVLAGLVVECFGGGGEQGRGGRRETNGFSSALRVGVLDELESGLLANPVVAHIHLLHGGFCDLV